VIVVESESLFSILGMNTDRCGDIAVRVGETAALLDVHWPKLAYT
jgi:hypothetical protein